MNISFLMVCLVVLGSICIPYFLLNFSEHKEKSNKQVKIKNAIKEYNLNISQSDIWGNMYIGFDANQQKVLILKISSAETFEHLLELDLIYKCEIVEKRKTIKISNKQEHLLERLDLDILFKNKDHLLLNFYDRGQMIPENFELQRIKKWRTILSGTKTSNILEKKLVG